MSKRKMSDSEEHANWSTEQLREFLKGVSNVGYISNYFKHMKGNIIRKTSFLEDHYPQNKITFSVRVKMIVDGILDANQLPTCRVCGERKAKFARGTLDFEETCYERKCVKQVKVERTRKAWDERYGGHPLRNEAFLEKRKRTNVERYGGSSPAASEEVKAKIKATNVERYGVEYVTQNDEIRKRQQATLDAKYGKDRKPIVENTKRTMRSRYGVDCPYHIPGVKEKTTQTNIERYGGHPSASPDVKAKSKLTNREKYGVDHPMKSPPIRDRVRQSILDTIAERGDEIVSLRRITSTERYGVDNPAKSETVKYRIKEAFRHRYGVDNPSQSGEVKQKKVQTSLDRYGHPHYMTSTLSPEAIDVLNNADKLQEYYSTYGGLRASDMIGVDDKTFYAYMRKHGIAVDETVGTSFGERELIEYIRSLGIEVVTKYRDGMDGKEIDIYLPNHQIGIEYNGVYWHCELYRDAQYHLEKTKTAASQGIRLIQLFEDEWHDRKEVVKEKLRFMLGIRTERVYARKCHVQQVKHSDLKNFYDNNHIQGHGPGSTALTLTHNDTIVAAMSFRKTGKAGEVELIRYATSKSVVGGFSKLLKHSIRVLKDQGISRIVSFADKRWSVGDVYHNCGFVHEYDTAPDYQYVVGQRRERKQKFRRNRLPSILKNFDPAKSEIRNMNDHGYYRIFDCGLMKFSMAI